MPIVVTQFALIATIALDSDDVVPVLVECTLPQIVFDWSRKWKGRLQRGGREESLQYGQW